MKKTILFWAALFIFIFPAGGQTDYFEALTLAEVKNFPVYTHRVHIPSEETPRGTLLAFETCEGRRGKMLIHQRGGVPLLSWVTYQDSGESYCSGRKKLPKGSAHLDLDQKNGTKGFPDFLWNNEAGNTWSLTPTRDARIHTFVQTSFDCGIVKFEGPEVLQAGGSFSQPFRVRVYGSMRIAAKVKVDLILKKQLELECPVPYSPESDRYLDGAVIPGGRVEVDFGENNPCVLDIWGELWPDVPPGKYYLVAMVDTEDKLHEVNERNNVVFQEVEVIAADDKEETMLEPRDDGNIYPYPLHQLTLSNHTRVAYVDEGEGPYTLLFIHGLNGYHQAWKKNIDGLREDYRCIALDLPGNGRSSTGDYPYTIEYFASIVSEFITELGLENVVLIGHSMGGQIVGIVASNGIPEVKKAVMIAPSGLKEISEENKRKVLLIAQPDLIKKRSNWVLKMGFDRSFASGQLPEDAQFMFDYRTRMRERPEYFNAFCEMTYKLTAAIMDEIILDDLPSIDIPTLVLWGREDSALDYNLAEEIKSRVPNCDY
jgi:pimeloyl-ACP methyl ester carboxylesterase